MKMTKKLLLVTMVTSMFAANVFAMENNQPAIENQEENTEETGFYEENKTAILSAAAILGAVAVVTGGYFGYQYFGKDLCAKLFSKTAQKVETKKDVAPAKTTLLKKTKNGLNNTVYCVKNPKYTVNQVKNAANYSKNRVVNFFKSIGTLLTTDSEKTATKPAPVK